MNDNSNATEKKGPYAHIDWEKVPKKDLERLTKTIKDCLQSIDEVIAKNQTPDCAEAAEFAKGNNLEPSEREGWFVEPNNLVWFYNPILNKCHEGAVWWEDANQAWVAKVGNHSVLFNSRDRAMESVEKRSSNSPIWDPRD